MADVTGIQQGQLSADEIAEAGNRWKLHHEAAFAALADGTTVIIEITTGQYVASRDWQAAWDEFAGKYGFDRPSYMFTVGKPIFVGGGLWLKSSAR